MNILYFKAFSVNKGLLSFTDRFTKYLPEHDSSIYLPSKSKRFTLIRSPHIYKKSKEQFKIKTYSNLSYIFNSFLRFPNIRNKYLKVKSYKKSRCEYYSKVFLSNFFCKYFYKNKFKHIFIKADRNNFIKHIRFQLFKRVLSKKSINILEKIIYKQLKFKNRLEFFYKKILIIGSSLKTNKIFVK